MSRHQPTCLTAQQCACTVVAVMRCLLCALFVASTPALAQGVGAPAADTPVADTPVTDTQPLPMAAASPDEASPDDASLTEQAANYMRDYLSDSRRVGTLVGNIIGGALTAHPAGPVVGGLVGFFIGKTSLFSQGDQRATEATRFIDPRRPIVPEPGQAVTGLSFGTGQSINFSTAPPAATQPGGAQASSVVPTPAPEVLTMRPVLAQPEAAAAAHPNLALVPSEQSLQTPPVIERSIPQPAPKLQQAAPQSPTAMHQVTPASQPAPVRQQPLPALPLPSVQQQTAAAAPQPSPTTQQTTPASLPPVSPRPAPTPTRIVQEPVPITLQVVSLPLPVAPPARGFSREQIAQLCSGRLPGASDPRLKNICFYYQTN